LLLGEVYLLLEAIVAWNYEEVERKLSQTCLLDVVIPPFGDGVELE